MDNDHACNASDDVSLVRFRRKLVESVIIGLSGQFGGRTMGRIMITRIVPVLLGSRFVERGNDVRQWGQRST